MSKRVDVTRLHASEPAVSGRDDVAVEEPLEVRLHGRPFSVIMRTPGADRELAAGFLFAERVVRDGDDLGTIEYCADPKAETRLAANVVNVTFADPSRATAALASARRFTTNASCGLCGRETIESLKSGCPALAASWSLDPAVLLTLPERLRARQTLFEITGGLHAAGLFTREGELVDIAEDVGRHNAVDKVIGRAIMRDALPLGDHVLFVSGRTSFEIVQKALLAGIAVVASVSAPSSLAIELASEMNITLIGFVRGDTFNVYTNGARIRT